MISTLQKWMLPAGQVLARYSVALFFLAFGAAKVHPLGGGGHPSAPRPQSLPVLAPPAVRPADGVEHHRRGGDRARRHGRSAADRAAPLRHR
jgi:hypothetical protein